MVCAGPGAVTARAGGPAHGPGGPLYLNLAGRLPAHATLGAFRHVSAHAETLTFLALAALAAVGVILVAVNLLERHGHP